MPAALPSDPSSGLFKNGYTSYKSDSAQHLLAVRELASMIKTSFGPDGRAKIIVNRLGKTFLTSDAATMLREMEVVHPAAKLVVMAAQQQAADCGDGSSLTLMIVGELVAKAEDLLRIGMSPAEVVEGFEQAAQIADSELNKLICGEATSSELEKAVKPVIASKLADDADLLAPLVSEAVNIVMPADRRKFDVDNIRVVKILGASLEISQVLKGLVFPVAPEGSVKSAKSAKVAVFTAPVDIATTETKGTVLLHNASELLSFSKDEEKQIDEFVSKLASAGVGVVIAGSGVGQIMLHYLNRYGILVHRIPSKFDLQRLCRVTGAAPQPKLCVPPSDQLGLVDQVGVKEIGGDRVTIFEQNESSTRTATIVLRGATQSSLDDIDRVLQQAVAAVKTLTRDPRLVPGSGYSEIALASAVTQEGEKTPGVRQHAIKKFAEALEVVPRSLAENSGEDAQEVLSQLYARNSRQDLSTDVVDSFQVKKSAIKLASEAAVTVLSVDQVVVARRAGGPEIPKQGGDWDQD